MPEARVYKAWVFEDGGATVLARIRGNSGAYITQASLSTITYNVYDLDDSDAAVTNGSVTISSSVFDTLQTGDDRWTADSVGFNFAFSLPVAAFPNGATTTNNYRRYRIEIKFTPSSGTVFFLVVEPNARKIIQS